MDSKPKKIMHIGGSVKLRWYSLMLVAVVTFILFSNSYNVHIQNSLQAKTSFPKSALSQTADDGVHNVLKETVRINASEIGSPPNMETKLNPPNDMQSWTIRSGDTFSGILQRFGAYPSYSSIISHGKSIKPLINLKAGKTLHLKVKDNQLEELIYEHSTTEHFFLYRENGDYVVENRVLPIEIREAFANAVIEDSFYLTGKKIGLSDEIIIETAQILRWDIDFILDIRSGDRFSILYSEKYLHGEKIGDGEIIGVKFTTQGKTRYAIRHIPKNGDTKYFSLDGKNLQKPFLRSPLEFTRISSVFNPRRLHPIHKRIKPHRGVDYAAPTGTPVSASGDGKVIYRGWKSGYGNTVIIRHAGVYSTLYAHLSKFSGRVRLNSRVKQEETIGYVGTTGYATGPHLHYEFRINRVHKNPLTVKLPDSSPLARSQLKEFKYISKPIVKKLSTLSSSFASANP